MSLGHRKIEGQTVAAVAATIVGHYCSFPGGLKIMGFS